MPSRPIAGQTFTFEIELVSQANTKVFQSSPTLDAADFRKSINGGTFGALDNTPTVTPSGTTQVQIVLSAAETTSAGVSGRIKVRAEDTSGAQWCSSSILWFVFATEDDSLATAAALTIVDDLLDTEIPALTTAVGLLPTTATIATAVWASGTRTLTSFGTLIADIWANVTRTLTQTAAQVTASVSGSDLTIVRGVTFSATLTGLTIPATWRNVYFTAKQHRAVADTEAVVQIVVSNPAAPLTDGLLRINRAAGTLANGSLVVNQGAGTVAITLADDASTLLVSGAYVYDVKTLLSDGTSVLLTAANVTVADTVTETIA